MSKKKNTLRDLDDFLKQQAATIVPPSTLGGKIEQQPAPAVVTPAPTHQGEVSSEKIVQELSALSAREGAAFRYKLCDIIIQSLGTNSHASPEDMMLINTALYLKSGANWKESIRSYWKGKAGS